MLGLWYACSEDILAKTINPTLAGMSGIEVSSHPMGISGVEYPGEGEVILAFGAKVFDRLKAIGAVPKNRTVDSLRGQPIKSPQGGHWFVTYDPGMGMSDASKPDEIRWDLRLASRFILTGTINPVIGNYSYADDFSAVLEYVDWKATTTAKKVDVSLDTETMGLWPWYPDKEIVCVQVSVEEGVSDVVYTYGKTKEQLYKVILQLDTLLNDPRVALKGANLKYDLQWLRVKWGIRSTNFTMDTLIVGSLLDENRSNSLKNHARIYTDMGGYDEPLKGTYDKGHMELVPKEDLLTYAGGDTDVTLRVANQMKRELKQQPDLARFYVNILHKSSRAFENIEYRGMLVDQKEYAKLKKELEDDINRLEIEMIKLLPGRVRVKHSEEIAVKRMSGKSPFTAKILKDLFFSPTGWNLKPVILTAKTQEPSTAHDHLVLYAEHPNAGPFVALLEELSSARKTLSTYVIGFLEHLRPDGKFHPTYALFAGSMFGGANDDAGAATGRTSCKNPAAQTIPKLTKWAGKIRKCFPSPPGKVFWQCDFSQGELKITACVANENTMLGAYKQGLDLHCVTGSKLASMSLEDFLALEADDPKHFKLWRTRAKPANFGLLYGMGAEGFREYARTGYGLKLTSEEAVAIRDGFFTLYPGLPRWHKEYKAFVHKHGFVRSPLGRIRHLPLIHSPLQDVRAEAERQAINAPIQSCLSDMCQWAIAILEDAYGDAGDLEIIGMTHDSIYGYAPEHNAVEWMRRVTEVMSTLPLKKVFGWEPQLVFTADAEIGTTMFDLEKVDLSITA